MAVATLTDVALVAWPSCRDQRLELQGRRQPCLLIVAEGAAPPVDTTALEDWARESADPTEVHARITALASRARSALDDRPSLDADAILHWNGGWVALRPIEGRLVARLIGSFESVTSRADLEHAGWGHAVDGRALDLQLVRLRRRIAPLGLEIRNLRGQGFLLCGAER